MLRPQPPLTDGQGLAMQRLGLGQLRSLPQQDTEELEARGQVGAVGRQQPPPLGERLTCDVLGCRVVT